jgi:hypothetical protein
LVSSQEKAPQGEGLGLLKNLLWEVKETAADSPFSSMPIFFRDKGGRAIYWDRASRA